MGPRVWTVEEASCRWGDATYRGSENLNKVHGPRCSDTGHYGAQDRDLFRGDTHKGNPRSAPDHCPEKSFQAGAPEGGARQSPEVPRVEEIEVRVWEGAGYRHNKAEYERGPGLPEISRGSPSVSS